VSTTGRRIRDDAGVSGLEDIGSILGRALGTSPADARLAAVCSAWRAAAGPLADEAWPARFARDGGLIVNCSSSVLAGDLNMRSPELLARLREQACDLPALRFKVGPVPGPGGG
jgi:predicted nucleic acid-binding Zn ribbon protein